MIRELAALAIKQARGDLIEAVFLLRAYRTTLPRFGHSEPVDTGNMLVERRVSAIYKDLPGGQLLGPTFDYTHRLLDPDLAGDEPIDEPEAGPDTGEKIVRVSDILGDEGLIEDDPVAADSTLLTWRTSPALRPNIRWGATRGCRHWPAATRAFCWHSPIRPSAAMRAATRLPARSASAKSMSR
jgi:alpha-D-ribose 1-methylphosphonate 5-triphosphate synthase subunit PhnI